MHLGLLSYFRGNKGALIAPECILIACLGVSPPLLIPPELQWQRQGAGRASDWLDGRLISVRIMETQPRVTGI